MPVRNWPDPDEEAAYVERSRQSWDRILAARRTATVGDAQAVSTMSANYPHMSPGTVVPLTRAGVAPDDPLATHVATQEAKLNKKKRGFWGAVGDWVNPGNLVGNVGEFVVGDVLNPLGGAALGALKPTTRVGLAALSAPYEIATGMVRNIADVGGNVAAGFASGAAVGAAIGLPFGGVGSIPGAGVGAIVGGIAGLGAGALATMRGVEIESEEGLVNPLEQSTFIQGLGSAGFGSGYLPGGTAHERAADAARRSAAISGHGLTPGRFLATAVSEPGTQPYNLLSGAMDAATAWRLDPTFAAGQAVNKWRKVQRGFTGSEREIRAAVAAGRPVEEVAEEALQAVPRATVDRPITVEDLSTTLEPRGRPGYGAETTGGRSPDEPPWGTEPPPQVQHFVYRDENGNVGGVLKVLPGEGGLEVAVRPDLRRQGIATNLYKQAEEAGIDVAELTGRTGYTAEGAAFTAGRVKNDVGMERAEAGLVEGARKTIIGEKVDAWLGTKKGQRALQWFADQDFDAIHRQLGPKVEVGTVRELADAKTIEEVDAILRPKLGLSRGLEEKPAVGGFGMSVKRVSANIPVYDKVRSSRLWSDLPSGKVDYADPTEATHQFRLLLKDANISEEAAGPHIEEFARHLLKGTFEDRRLADAVVYRALGGAQGKVATSGAGQAFMNRLARRASASDQQVLRALIDEDVTKTGSTHASLDGKTQNLVSSGFLTDHFDNGFDIDRNSLRGIRAATSKYARIANNSKVQVGVSALSGMTDNIWKPSALLRGAWTVRVIGEEQIRMAAAGRLSLFNHPLSYLAWAMDDSGTISRILNKASGGRVTTGGRGSVDVRGERFSREGSTIESAADDIEAELLDAADDYATATNYRQTAEGWYGNDLTAAGHRETYARGQQGHVEAVAENIDQAYGDPVMRMLASEPRHVVREWFINGEGSVYRKALVDKHGAPLSSNADIDRHLDNAQRTLNKIMGRVDATRVPANVSEAPGMVKTTGFGAPGSSTVRDAIATGEINGIPLRLKNGKPNPEAMSELRRIEDELPERITGSAAHLPNDRWKAWRDRGVQSFYTALMTRPSAKLSRSPAFRQAYWAEAENVITELTPAAQTRLLANARKAKLDNAAVKRLELRAKASNGDLTLDDADLLLKGRGLDETQKLLYDAAQRGQISDVLRIIMPFAEAQKEVMSTWAKLGLVDNVNVIPKAAKFMNAARGSGYFYKDPGTGEEMFTFPGSQLVTETLLGTPVPLTGRVQGLNTFGTGIVPGLGPAVQIPTRWFLPDKPQYDDLRKFIDPFGASASETEGLLESMAPGWVGALRKAFADPESDRTFGNAVKDTWAQGVSQGRYSTETPEDIREGLEHAKSTARWLYIIKAGSQVFGAPTPPSPAFMAMDKDGRWHMAKALSEDYRTMMEDPEIGFDGANAAFINKYGNNAAAFMQSKSFSTVPVAPSTGDFRAWTRTAEAQQLQEKYGDVYALFGPQGEGFDYTQYLRNINAGATETLTPEQFAEQTNDRQGKMIYYNYKDRFGPTPSKEQREWLSSLREQLREKFPGFDIPVPGKPDTETIKQQFIPQIEKAVADPTLADNDVARATRAYLQARQMADQAAQAAGYKSFHQAKNAAPLRDWLRQVLDALTLKVPDFGPMAERVFDREMIDDNTPEQTAAVA